MYRGKAYWINKDVTSLRLEQAIVREFANITLNEMTVSVTDRHLDKLLKDSLENINQNFQKALATGGMVIKPLGTEGVQFVPQSSFIPIEYDVNGRLTKVIFPEIKCISKSEYLTRLEYHSLDAVSGLTITNRAFGSNFAETLGKEIPLTSVPEWAEIPPTMSYPLMKRCVFGYYVNPLDNTIDGSFTGVSMFDSAKHLIRLTDIQFGRLDWEFESGERVIHADFSAFMNDDSTASSGIFKGKSKSRTLELPKLKNRLYKSMSLEKDTFFKEFSPNLRQSDLISGLEEYKRSIEFAVGLSYGDLSNPQSVEKTATEIKSSKKRKYNTVLAIQNNLKNCLEDLVYAFAFYNDMATQNYEFICDFKDSILVDEETERKQDIQDLQLGIIRPEEYRAKWYGETVDEALKNLPQTAEVLE